MKSDKKVFMVLIIFLVLMGAIGVVGATWANDSYSHAKNITLLGTGTELSNYPYLVTIAKESEMQSDYDDLLFYDQPVRNGGNVINFEIETYNSTAAIIWLNITTLPMAGKTISVYYGNDTVESTQDSKAVWDNAYVGVWHMSDNIDYNWNNYKVAEGVITANVTQHYIIAEPSVFYDVSEGIFKMWMRERHSTGPAVDYLGYWESLNGYDWTQIKTGLLSGAEGVNRCRHPYVMEHPDNPGEYWLYNFNASTNKEDLWHGWNETNWTIDTYGIFSASDVGGASLIGNVFVWRENASDWYAIVENNAPVWSADYATSSDGKSWSFHGQVVVSGFPSGSLSGPNIHKNNGTYYMWFHGNKNVALGIPSDTYVATCTDRQSWVYQPGFEILRDQDWEGAGLSLGQLADPTFAEKDGELYIFYQGAHDQSPGATWPHRIGLVHLNESLQEVCNHIDAGNDQKAKDSSTNERDGTLTNIESSQHGAIGKCMDFNGINSYINLGTVLNLPMGTHELWFNATTIDTVIKQVYTHNNMAGGTPHVVARVAETDSVDKLKSYVGGNGFDEYNVNPNQFYSMSIVSNSSGNDVLYVNGNVIDTNTHGTAYAADTSRWHFGTSRALSYWYAGTIDEGRVSNIVRSSDWINLSYQIVVNESYVIFGEEQQQESTTPVISNITNGSVSSTSQWIAWDVNQTAHNQVVYSNESDLTPTYYSSWQNSTNAPNITLSGLESSTQYWYQVWSYNTTNTSLSDNSSTLSFTTTGVDTSFTVTLPSGYTYLKFEPANSTIVNVAPNGQTDSQEFYNVTNTGGINLDIRLQLNETVPNIVLKADSDNNPTGAKEVNTTLVTIYTNVVPTGTADIWLWSDFTYAVEQDTNKTISINVTQSI